MGRYSLARVIVVDSKLVKGAKGVEIGWRRLSRDFFDFSILIGEKLKFGVDSYEELKNGMYFQ
jgi:hypothetical protein